MSRTTLRIMASVERRLNRYTDLALTACGFDEEVEKAERHRDRLMKYLENEIEALVNERKLP